MMRASLLRTQAAEDFRAHGTPSLRVTVKIRERLSDTLTATLMLPKAHLASRIWHQAGLVGQPAHQNKTRNFGDARVTMRARLGVRSPIIQSTVCF